MNCIIAESVSFAIAESFQNQRFITIRIHEGNGSMEITGIVTEIDRQRSKIKFSHEHGVEWFPMADILDVLIGFDD